MKLLHRLLSWLAPPSRGTPAVVQPQSRADKYTPMAGLLEKQREVEQKQVDAFARSVKDAYDKIQVWTPPPPLQPGSAAMDAAAAKGTTVTLTAAMDDSVGGLPAFKAVLLEFGTQMQLLPWYMRQGFIGYQSAAFIAQHWLVYKACAVPIDDAVRNGYEVTTATGEDLDEDALAIIKADYNRERELDQEVNKMMDDLERKNPGEFQRYIMFPMLKKRLAKEKGIIL